MNGEPRRDKSVQIAKKHPLIAQNGSKAGEKNRNPTNPLPQIQAASKAVVNAGVQLPCLVQLDQFFEEQAAE